MKSPKFHVTESLIQVRLLFLLLHLQLLLSCVIFCVLIVVCRRWLSLK